MMADDDPRMIPAVEMLRRTGAEEFQIRYCEEEQPVIWMAVGRWGGRWETGAGMEPLTAVFRLCDQVIDGGQCMHCKRTTGFVPDLDTPPLDDLVCWYQWDPELVTFRRGCEGGNG